MNKNEMTVILAVIAVVALLLTYMYIDEYQDGVGERECMSQVKDIETEAGYSPDCDL